MERKIDERTLRALFNDIVAWFKKKDVEWEGEFSTDTFIYLDGKQYKATGEYVQDRKPSEVTQYADDRGLTMTFEGPLYDVINGELYKTREQFDKLFEKRGLYYEQGNSWNLTVFK